MKGKRKGKEKKKKYREYNKLLPSVTHKYGMSVDFSVLFRDSPFPSLKRWEKETRKMRRKRKEKEE